MGSHRAAQLWRSLALLDFPGRGAKRSCFSPSVRAGYLTSLERPCGAADFAGHGLARLQDSILPHLSRFSTPRGPATYPEGRFPLAIQT